MRQHVIKKLEVLRPHAHEIVRVRVVLGYSLIGNKNRRCSASFAVQLKGRVIPLQQIGHSTGAAVDRAIPALFTTVDEHFKRELRHHRELPLKRAQPMAA